MATTPYQRCCPVATTPYHPLPSLLSRGYHPCCTHDMPLPTREHVPCLPPPSNTSSERFSGALRRRLPPRYAGEMDWLNEVYGHSPHFAWDAVAGEYRTPTLPLVTTPCMRMGRRRQRVPKPNPGPGPNLPLTLP